MHSQVALITGGAGIAPMYQLMNAILKNPDDKTKVILIFGINSDEDVLFEPEFRELESKFPDRFKAVYTVRIPTKNSPFPKGHVTRELLKAHIPSPDERDVKVLFCGPPAMETSIAGSKGFFGTQGGVGGVLKEMAYSNDKVFKL